MASKLLKRNERSVTGADDDHDSTATLTYVPAASSAQQSSSLVENASLPVTSSHAPVLPATLIDESAVTYLMVLCDVLLMLQVEQKAIAFQDISPSSKAVPKGTDYVIFNQKSSFATSVDESSFTVVPYVPEIPNGKKPKRKENSSTEVPSFESCDSICGVTISDNQLPVVVFDAQTVGPLDLGNSFFFAGSIVNKCLSVSVVSVLSSTQLEVDFQSFLAADATGKTVNEEPFFAGFYLSDSDFSDGLLSSVRNLICTLAPVFMHLASSSTGLKHASWYCSGKFCDPVHVQTKKPGWVVHSESPPMVSSSNGFDAIFPSGKYSASVVDPDSLRESRVSQFYGVIKDAHLDDSKVPHCMTILKALNFEQRLPTVHSTTMHLVEQDAIWSYVDPSSCEFVHVLPVLNVSQFDSLNKSQKARYLKRMAWIASRSQLVPGSNSVFADRYFAVRTTGCFVLGQKDSIIAKSHEYELFKKFYSSKGVTDLQLPQASLFTDEIPGIQKIRSAAARDQSKQNPNSFIADSNIMPAQLYTESELNTLRRQMNIFPTLQFENNSCWLEAAINVLFSVSKARCRICVLKNPTAKILLSLFNIMLVYGHGPIPAVECRRCGVYPVDDKTPPPILGTQGYKSIFPDNHSGWGSYGCPTETLNHFFGELEIEPVTVVHGTFKEQDIKTNEVTFVVFRDSANVVVEETLFRLHSVSAVVFGNGAHFFSVCKAVNTPDWTVKDNFADVFRTFNTFTDAMSYANKLHFEQGKALYTVQLAVYVNDTAGCLLTSSLVESDSSKYSYTYDGGCSSDDIEGQVVVYANVGHRDSQKKCPRIAGKGSDAEISSSFHFVTRRVEGLIIPQTGEGVDHRQNSLVLSYKRRFPHLTETFEKFAPPSCRVLDVQEIPNRLTLKCLGATYVVVKDESRQNECFAFCRRQTWIAIDTETAPLNSGCDLVQIGNEVVVYLIAVAERREFLLSIASLLANDSEKTVFQFGCDDFQKFAMQMEVSSYKCLVKDVQLEHSPGGAAKRISIVDLFSDSFKQVKPLKIISKTWRLSGWDNPVLHSNQEEYAALDVVCLSHLAKRFYPDICSKSKSI